MRNLVILMLPSYTPLGLDLLNRDEVERAIAWQIKGGSKYADYLVCEVKNGELYAIDNGEKIDPINTLYTEKAWQEFQQLLLKGHQEVSSYL